MSRFISRALGAAAALTLLAPSASALAPIVAKGSKFFNSQTGAQWYIKGVAYQLNPYSLDGNDPGQCEIDAALMQSLGANAIRVYHVNPQTNHDQCMQSFSNHGIYLFIDLDTFSSTITQTAPEWTPAQYGAFKYVMDAFHKYDNVAGFFTGNEILNTVGPQTNCMPYLKAATADMKAYRDAAGYRKIPIGYSHADVAGLRPVLQNYLACGNPDQAIDFFGLNAYEWCGTNTFEGSGYAYLLNQTLEYPVPIFMSETGCIVPLPRTFADQTALLGPQMANKWSGAIIYEWIQEANHYGLVSYSGITDAFDLSDAGNIRNGTPQPIVPDFANLKSQWATLNPTGVQMAQYTPTETAMACPAYTAGVWEVDPSAALPTLGLNVAIPTSSALALANLGLTGPFTTPNANAIAVTSAAASTTAAASSSARQSSSGAASSASSARSSGAAAASSASSGAASSASGAAGSASSRASAATSGAASAAASATSRASSAAASTTPNAAARVGAGMAAGLVGVAAVML